MFRKQGDATACIWQNNSSRVSYGAYDLPSHGFWLGFYQVCIPSCVEGLKYNQKAVCYPCNIHAILYQWEYLARWALTEVERIPRQVRLLTAFVV